MKIKLIAAIVGVMLIASCEEEFTPKPMAYGRIDLPAHEYISPNAETWSCPYTFEASKLSYLTIDPKYKAEQCWYNLYYPRLRATIHITYFELDGDVALQIEENRKLAMKHISKATHINESIIENDSARVFGILFDFRGETASDMQFFLTDSSNHFLRGALYFNVKPNKDSLDPVITYVKKDIEHFIESFRWIDRSAEN